MIAHEVPADCLSLPGNRAGHGWARPYHSRLKEKKGGPVEWAALG